MQTVLIVESADPIRTELAIALERKYQVLSCSDGHEALQLLETHRPDGMILNLILYHIDGIQLLESSSHRPKVILALSTLHPDYIGSRLRTLGIGYLVLLPSSIQNITHRFNNMMEAQRLSVPVELQQRTLHHLHILCMPPLDGYRMLQVGIPLFAQDRSQLMTKDLYPNIALLCNSDNWQQVERSIRCAIRAAWVLCDSSVWMEYFGDTTKPPSNKKFISLLSELIEA